jgi:hypothetical protein
MYLIWCGEIEKFSLLTMTSLASGPAGCFAPIRNETRRYTVIHCLWGFGLIVLYSRALTLAQGQIKLRVIVMIISACQGFWVEAPTLGLTASTSQGKIPHYPHDIRGRKEVR